LHLFADIFDLSADFKNKAADIPAVSADSGKTKRRLAACFPILI